MTKRRTFGHTWWGRAWIDALEHRARLDPNRLPRGRTYARHGRVLSLELAAGEISAVVAGNRPSPYRVVVRVLTYGEAEWDGVLDAIASRAAHAAALFDGELEPGIVDDARAAGVELLPDAGHLQPRCSCPDWADPCKHAAAVCYLVADELDADPFALLALRGRTRDEVVAGLRRRRAAASRTVPTVAASDTARDPGVVAREAWGASREAAVAELPSPPRPRPHPGLPAAWPTDPPAAAPFDRDGLRRLAADAATRAWSLARGDAGSGLDLDAEVDLARRAGDRLGTPALATLASAAGVAPAELAGRAVAWLHGGSDGVDVLAEPPWRPPAAELAAARDRLVDRAGGDGRRARVQQNRVTLGDVQIRLDRSGRWWLFTKTAGRWQLAAPPATTVDDLDLDLTSRRIA